MRATSIADYTQHPVPFKAYIRLSRTPFSIGDRLLQRHGECAKEMKNDEFAYLFVIQVENVILPVSFGLCNALQKTDA